MQIFYRKVTHQYANSGLFYIWFLAGYLNICYPAFGQIPDIWPDIRYLARYPVFGQISGIWPDIRYLAENQIQYKVFAEYPDIWPGTKARYPVDPLYEVDENPLF